MKISEAKNGKVRYTESKIASGGSRLKTGGGRLKLQRDEPDFMEYLSEKDRQSMTAFRRNWTSSLSD